MKSPQTAQCPRTLLRLLFWLSKQRRLENICSRQVTFQQFLPPEESRWICLVHQFDDLLLIRGVERSHRNIPNCSKLAAVVEMFILQTYEVPDKSPEHLQELQDTSNSFGGNGGELRLVKLIFCKSLLACHLLQDQPEYPG